MNGSTPEVLYNIINDGVISFSSEILRSKFRREQFLDKDFFPISLYYLGMTTLYDNYEMQLPNLSMKTIFTDYYNVLSQLRGNKDDYVPYFKQFLKDHEVSGLAECYFKHY